MKKKSNRNCVNEGKAMANVPAGSFMSWKVRCIESNGIVNVYYYSPELGAFALREINGVLMKGPDGSRKKFNLFFRAVKFGRLNSFDLEYAKNEWPKKQPGNRIVTSKDSVKGRAEVNAVAKINSRAEPNRSHLPQPKVGDTYEWNAVVKSGKKVYKRFPKKTVVSAVSNDLVLAVSPGVGTFERQIVPFGLVKMADYVSHPLVGKWKGSYKLSGSFDHLFPLKNGNSGVIHGMTDNLRISKSCRVSARAEIQVAAGKFDTFRIDCRYKPFTHTDTFYYAPKVRMWIKRISAGHTLPLLDKTKIFDVEYELTNYKLADEIRKPSSK